MIFYVQDDEEPEKAGGGAVRDSEDNPGKRSGDLWAEDQVGREAGGWLGWAVSDGRPRPGEEQLLFVTVLSS